MAELFGNIINTIFGLLGIVIVLSVVIHTFFLKEKVETAVVINKQSYDRQVYRKGQAPFLKREYIITFLCRDKKRNFEVSELSYESYKMNQKGTLRYKGSKLIDFK